MGRRPDRLELASAVVVRISLGSAVAQAAHAVAARATRELLVEGTYEGESLDDKMLDAGWDVKAIRNAAPLVEFTQTSNRGAAKTYSDTGIASPVVFRRTSHNGRTTSGFSATTPWASRRSPATPSH